MQFKYHNIFDALNVNFLRTHIKIEGQLIMATAKVTT